MTLLVPHCLPWRQVGGCPLHECGLACLALATAAALLFHLSVLRRAKVTLQRISLEYSAPNNLIYSDYCLTYHIFSPLKRCHRIGGEEQSLGWQLGTSPQTSDYLDEFSNSSKLRRINGTVFVTQLVVQYPAFAASSTSVRHPNDLSSRVKHSFRHLVQCLLSSSFS